MIKRLLLPLAIVAAWLSSFSFAPAQNGPTPSNFVTSQVTCSNTAGVLVAARPSANHMATIEQTGSTAFYVGAANVTTSNGFLIPGTANSSYTVAVSTAVYCVTASSTAVVTVVETW